MILIVILYAILASTFVFAKYAVAFSTPTFLIGFRMIIAGLMLLGFCLIKGRGRLHINVTDYWLFFKTALFHIYLAFTLEFWALQYVGALKTTMIFAFTPFIAALLAYGLYGERLNRAKKIGILIGATGLVPVLLASGEVSLSQSIWLTIGLPDLALLGAVISGAYAWFLVKQLMQRGYSFVIINGVAMLVGGMLSMITSIMVSGFTMPVSNWPSFLWWTMMLIISANIIVYNLYGALLRRYSITFLTFAGFLCPSFGALYEWGLTGKAVSWHYLVSLVLVIAGLYIFYRQELAKDSSIN
jgi:drug/metabolite transporter (DMT)-like permease